MTLTEAIPLAMPLDPAGALISWLNNIGIFVFAVSGALAAIRRQSDILGVLVLAFVTSSAGGICRDVLIGQLPPAVVRETFALFLSLGAGFLTYFAYPIVNRLAYPIDLFDALGLGAFAVLGANKALVYGIDPIWAVGLGAITGVGGGVARDMLLAEVPIILRREVYATAAIFGASVLVAGKLWHPEYEKAWMIFGAVGCSGIRMLSLHRAWHLPKRQVK